MDNKMFSNAIELLRTEHMDAIKKNKIVNEIVIAALDRKQMAMLEDAILFYPAQNKLEPLDYEVSLLQGDLADEAEISRPEDGSVLVSFHETRPSSRDHIPNGIHTDLEHPYVVFYNCGQESLTVDGYKLEPNKLILLKSGEALDHSEVRRAFEEFCKSLDLRETQKEMDEKMRKDKKKKEEERKEDKKD